MPLKWDLVNETFSDTGTGPYNLGLANGRRRFSEVVTQSDTGSVFVHISHQSAAQYMGALGSFKDTGFHQLTIDTVLYGSNGASAVSFSSGTKDVVNDIPAANQPTWYFDTGRPDFPTVNDLWLDPITASINWNHQDTGGDTQWIETGVGGGGFNTDTVRPGEIFNGKITESNGSNAATFHLKTIGGDDPSGGDPVYIRFPDGTLRTATAALSVTAPSGATLGATNGNPFRVWVAIVDDGGTLRLAVRNCSDSAGVEGFPSIGELDSTAIGTGSDSTKVTYTDSAVTDGGYVIAAFADYDSGLTTAGTWDASPTRIVQFGPGVPRPGTALTFKRDEDGASSSGSNTAPGDDTLPQQSECNVFLSLAYAPTAPQNIIRARGQIHITGAVANNIVAALFQDSTANPLCTSWNFFSGTTYIGLTPLTINWIEVAGGTTSVTWKLAGSVATGTTYFNSRGGAAAYSSSENSFLEIQEIMG